MVIKYHISPSNITEDFEVKVWQAEDDTPGAEVYTQDIPEDGGGGHPTSTTVTINGMDNVVHIVRLFGKTSGTMYHEWNTEPFTLGVEVFSPIRFKIGDGGDNTPAPNSDTFTHPDLDGLTADDYDVFRNNVGWLFPDEHYTVLASGFQLINPDKFNDEEEFTVQRRPIIPAQPVNDSVVGKLFGGFLDINADTEYSSSHLRKLIRFDGTCNYAFNVNPPRGYIFAFQHYGPSTGVGTIEFNNAPLLWNGTDKDTFEIPTFTEAAFIFDGDNWNVMYVKTSNPYGIVYKGSVNIGDIDPTDMSVTVTHNLGISDYHVSGTFWANDNNYNQHNDFAWIAYDKQANSFKLAIRDLALVVQNIRFEYVIIK